VVFLAAGSELHLLSPRRAKQGADAIRKSDLPSGWRRLTPQENKSLGVSRRAEKYRAPNGDVVSRRQVENIVARQKGWDSWSEYQRTAQTRTYRRQLRIAVEGKGLPDRPSSFRREAGISTDFSTAYRDFMEEGDLEGRWVETHSTGPDSAWADLQIAQGIRDEGAEYDIGDTPGGEQ
jgi:hypothetical protein